MGDSPTEPGSPLIWCPYTDREIPRAEATEEHIIALALGGNDRFVLPADRRANSDLGSQIEGALASEFFVARARTKLDVRGQSKKQPPPFRVKKAKDRETGKPLQLVWGRRIELYDPLAGAFRTGPVNFEATFAIDRTNRLRFLAKTFLSAGYKIYGDLFRRAVKHEEPRFLMNRARLDNLSDDELAPIKTTGFDWLKADMPDESAAEEFAYQEGICTVIPGTVLVFAPGRDRLHLFGGVLGQYLGMISVPAVTTEFPRTGGHDLGYAVVMSNKSITGGSHRSLIRALVNSIPPEMRPAI